MRGPAPPPESAEMVRVLREILLKVPTRDVARCCCVSRLWQSVVANRTFGSLHAEATANNISAASGPLLVTVTRVPGRPDEASFSIVSSSRLAPMPHRIVIPGGYSLSNICGGLLCFTLDFDSVQALAYICNCAEAPVFICNPVTGETATVPTPERYRVSPPGDTVYHHYALGFSPSTKEHKLFRFSFTPDSIYDDTEIDQRVCTLGSGGWRRRSYTSRRRLICNSPPVLIDGNLYLVTSGRIRVLGRDRNPDGMLVVDVATEVHRTCLLPVRADAYPQNRDPMVNTFEMSGRLCLAVYLYDPRRKLQFWVMSPPDQWVEGDDSNLCWDLRYSFYIDNSYRDSYGFSTRTSAWFDDGTLCITYRDILFKHSTTGRSPEPSPDADCPQCDHRLELPPTPSTCKWNIVGGHRPSLLSPLTLTTPQSSWDWDGEEERKEFEHAMFLALRRHQ